MKICLGALLNAGEHKTSPDRDKHMESIGKKQNKGNLSGSGGQC